MGLFRNKQHASPGGPVADATIEHPAPMGQWIEQEHVPLWIAPDPGGIAPRAASVELSVEMLDTPVQHSPITNWSPGTPYPGPPARFWKYIDLDSVKWWGRTGQGRLVWSEHTEFSLDVPANIPQDMAQHVATFQRFWGGFPSIARNRPTAFGDQVPQFQPQFPSNYALPEG